MYLYYKLFSDIELQFGMANFDACQYFNSFYCSFLWLIACSKMETLATTNQNKQLFKFAYFLIYKKVKFDIYYYFI